MAMQGFWKKAGLEFVETRVIRIPTVYSGFDDFWNPNVVPISPQSVSSTNHFQTP
jgi:hypothetical protein